MPADPPPHPPTVAVDLRALVPEATGIGVYTRDLLTALASRPGAPRYLGMAHAPVRGAAGLPMPPPEVQRAPLGVVWQQLTLPHRLARGDVDLLFSPLQTLPLRCPVPAVVTVHDLTVVLYPESHNLRVRWSQLPFLGRSLARAERVIAVSRATADDLAAHFPAETAGKVRVIHSGVAPRYRPAADRGELAAIRRDAGAPEGYLLYVGTLEPRKNLGTLVSAWELLRREDDAFPPLLLAGGTGWHSRGLRRRIETLAPLGLRHLGRVDDGELARLYRGALVFAYPSFYEGFGLPVLEAMASGVPCVTSDVSSLPEVAGGAALTVNPRDGRELAAALRKLVDDRDLAAELAARGRRRAAGFTWERTAQRTEEVLREALAAR